MTPNEWINCDKLPTDNKPKDLCGIMTCQGIWDAEIKSWRLLEDGKIKFEVRQWKEIQDGSTEQKEAAS